MLLSRSLSHLHVRLSLYPCSSSSPPLSLRSPLRVRSMGSEIHPLNNEIIHRFRFFNVYKDGCLHMFNQIHKVPPSSDPVAGVQSKDVVISSQPPISARIFLPKIRDPTRKLPLFFHIHGGGFCFESAFSPSHQKYLTALAAAAAECVVLSVEYGLFPDRPIPACYEDSWAGLQWVATHTNGDGPEWWLNNHADFGRVYIGGDSAGGNIAHNVAVRVGQSGLLNLVGMVLVHPYFGGTEDDEMWLYMCPSNGGLDDTRLKPSAGDLAQVGCKKVLVFIGERDHLRVVGKWYYEELKKSGWKGHIEIVENKGEPHCFHIDDSTSPNSMALLKHFASFIREQ